MRNFFYITFLLLLPAYLAAQSDFDLTQRYFNESVYNPASVGNSYTTSLFMHMRQQWAGFDGAPYTGVVSADTYSRKLSSGFGLMVAADKIGFTSTYSARFAYAYYLPLNAHSSLSLGIAAALVNRSMNTVGARVDNLNDPNLYTGNVSEFLPDFDVGLEYRGRVKFGASARHIGSKASKENIAATSLNVWTYASTRFDTEMDVSIEPVASYNYRDNIHRYEVGMLFYLQKRKSLKNYGDWVWIGAVYRFNRQLALMAGMYLTRQVKVGYSFDYGHSSLAKVSKFGTHELLLAWQLNRLFYRDCPCEAFGKSERMNKFY